MCVKPFPSPHPYYNVNYAKQAFFLAYDLHQLHYWHIHDNIVDSKACIA